MSSTAVDAVGMETRESSSWEPLLLLLQAPSKDTVAQLLQALWSSRSSGLQPSQKSYFQEQLRVSSTSQLDQVSDCLLKLIRKSVCESLNQSSIQELFPKDFHPRLQRLLAELLQNFQHEWREDAVKNQVSLARFRGISWKTLSSEQSSVDQRGTSKVGIVHLKVCNQSEQRNEEYSVNFQVSQASLGLIIDSLNTIRNQLASFASSA